MRAHVRLAAGTRLTGCRISRYCLLAGALLEAGGCSTPIVYSPVTPERTAAAYACAAMQLKDRAYFVIEDEPGTRLRARKAAPARSALARILLSDDRSALQEQVIVASLATGPGAARALTVGPERRDPLPASLQDSREVLAACAPDAPLAPAGLRCYARGRPLSAGEEVVVRTAQGGEVRGRAQALTGDALTVASPGGLQQVPLWAVTSLHRPMPVALRDVRRDRMVMGGAIGSAIGLAALVASFRAYENPLDQFVFALGGWVLPVLGFGVGGGIGWLTTAALPDPVWRWRSIPVETCR